MSSKSLEPIDPARALDGYWDAVVDRLPADSIRIPAAQPEDASTVRRLHALAPATPPAVEFSNRLLTDLLGQLSEQVPTAVALPETAPVSEQSPMHALKTTLPIPHEPSRSANRRHWFVRLELVAALLLIFGFAAFAMRQLPDRSIDSITSIPAAIQTGDATPHGDATAVPMYRGDVGRTGMMAGPGPSGSPVELWRLSTGGTIESSAAVIDSTVVVGSNDGTLYALDASSGDQRWAFSASSPVDGSPAIVDGVVYVGTQDGTIYAVDFATGTELWKFEGTRSGTSPLVVQGKVFAGSWESNTLFALDAKTGSTIWTLNAAAPFIRVGAYADGIVYYPSREGVLHAVDAATGAERWTFTMEIPVDVDSPAVLNGIVYQPTYQAGGTVYAIDASTGDELWRFSQPQGFRAPAVDADSVYLPGMSGTVYALDANTGTEQWSTPLGAAIVAAPALSDGVLYVGAQNSTLYAIDSATGSVSWEQGVDQKIERSPTVANGAVYVGTSAGSIFALGSASEGQSSDSDVSAAISAPGTPDSAFDPAAIEVIWQSTGGSPAFSSPVGLAQASNGDIYVGNSRLNQVQIISAEDGRVVGSVSDEAGEPLLFAFTGNFGYHASLGFDADGNLYVFDFNENRVRKFDPQFDVVLEWGSEGEGNGQFQLPVGSVDAANGRVYVADIINNRVQVFDLDGSFIDKWGGFGRLPGQFNEPGFAIVGPDGSVFVAEYSGGRIQRFDANGVHLATIGEPGSEPGQFNQPSSIAFDADGNMVVADFANGRLQIFRPDGSMIGVIERIPGYADVLAPSFVMFDRDGYLLVSDEASNSVIKLKLPSLI